MELGWVKMHGIENAKKHLLSEKVHSFTAIVENLRTNLTEPQSISRAKRTNLCMQLKQCGSWHVP